VWRGEASRSWVVERGLGLYVRYQVYLVSEAVCFKGPEKAFSFLLSCECFNVSYSMVSHSLSPKIFLALSPNIFVLF
jgi:hypothetical protein